MTDPHFRTRNTVIQIATEPAVRRDQSIDRMWGWVAGIAVVALIAFIIVAGWNGNSNAPAIRPGSDDRQRADDPHAAAGDDRQRARPAAGHAACERREVICRSKIARVARNGLPRRAAARASYATRRAEAERKRT